MGNDVIEISEPVFAGIIRGLETELRLQGEFRQELAKYPTQEQYNQCMMKAAQDPEYMKIVERAGKAGENATPEQAMAVQQKMQSEIEALANKTCPQKPVDTVWPNGRKSEKLAEIHQKAAEAAGVESSANRSDGNGRVVSLLYTYDVQPSVASALLTEIQYSIAIERIDRLCDYLNGPAGVGVVPDTAQQRDTTQRRMLIRGTGVKIFWIFTARETRVVNAANCRKFKDLTKRLM